MLDKNQTGKTLLKVSATDEDTLSYNKEIYYFLQDPQNPSLDPWLQPP